MGCWIASGGKPTTMIPLFAEAALLALGGFSLGLLLAYLAELHRRRQARSWTGTMREDDDE